MIKQDNIVELDVRASLRKKLEPFQQIMDAVASLEQEDVFVLHAIFKPTPLLGVMKVRGYAHKLEEIKPDHWIVAFAKGNKAKEQLKDMPLQNFAKLEEEEGDPDGK
jgi:hypothetical protein